MFGKRNRPPEPEPPRQDPGNPAGGGGANPSGGGGPSGPSGPSGLTGTPPGDAKLFPWPSNESYIACNLACGNIANNLASWVRMQDGRINAETYVAASGAIAGYAAQQTLREQDPTGRLHVAGTASATHICLAIP